MAASPASRPSQANILLEDGFEDGFSSWERGPQYCATSCIEVDSGVTAPDSRCSLSFWSGCPGSKRWAGSGLHRSVHAARPDLLVYYVRASETKTPKGNVLLCEDELAGCEGEGEGVAAWLTMSGCWQGSQAQIRLSDGDASIGAPYVSHAWHRVELRLDWRRKRLSLEVDGRAARGEGGGTSVGFCDRRVESVSLVRLANRNFAQVWYDSIRLQGPYAGAAAPVAAAPALAEPPPALVAAVAAPPPPAAPTASPPAPPLRALAPAPPPLELEVRAERGAALLEEASVALLCEQRVCCAFPTAALRVVGAGLLLYRATLAAAADGALSVRGAALPLHVFVDGARLGALPLPAPGGAPRGAPSLPLRAPAGAALVLVADVAPPAGEAAGAAAAGGFVGIGGCVAVGAALVFGWELCWLPRARLARVAPRLAPAPAPPAGPALWHAAFELPPPAEAGGGVLRATLAHAGGAVGLAMLNGVALAPLHAGGAPLLLPRGLLRLGQANELALLCGCTEAAPRAAPAVRLALAFLPPYDGLAPAPGGGWRALLGGAADGRRALAAPPSLLLQPLAGAPGGAAARERHDHERGRAFRLAFSPRLVEGKPTMIPTTRDQLCPVRT